MNMLFKRPVVGKSIVLCLIKRSGIVMALETQIFEGGISYVVIIRYLLVMELD